MKRTLLITLLAVALLGAFTLTVAMAADAPTKDVEMKYDAGGKFPPMQFSHAKHAGQKCETCHHKLAENPDMKCTTCHHEGQDKAYHDRKSEHACIGCHKAMKKGPTKCNDCHKK